MQSSFTATHTFMSGGGEMGQRVRDTDWSATPLGPMEQWPLCLKISLSIVLHSGYPMFIWWGEDLVMFHNDAYLPVLGNKHPDALGKSARRVWSEIWQDVGPLSDSVFQGKEVYLQDMLLYLGRKGFLEETYWTFSYSPIINEEGQVAGLFCACNEETGKIMGQRRLRTQQQITGLNARIKNAEELGRAAIEVLHENLHDIPFALLYFLNEKKEARLISSFGLRPEPAIVPGQFRMDDAAPLFLEMDKVFTSREPLVIEHLPEPLQQLIGTGMGTIQSAAVLPLQKSGFEELSGFLVCGISPHLGYNQEYQDYFSTTAAQISIAVGEVKAFIAERERSEALLELARTKDKAEQDLHSLFMQAPVAILILEGPEYKVELANDAYLYIVQREYSDLIHRSIFTVLPEISNQGFREIMDQVRITGQPFFQHEHRTLINRHGREHVLFLNIVYQPLKDRDGTLNKVMILLNEVTDQVLAKKKMEDMNHFLELEVEKRTKDLRQANRELERSNRELEQFAYAASHDMQEPLRKIQTFASFLTQNGREGVDETQHKYITKIQESAKRMSGIIDDLLNYSYQSGDQVFVDTDLDDVLRDVRNDLELLIKQKKAHIDADPLPVIQAFPSQMHQLFYNLLNNALKFSREDAPCLIRIKVRSLPEDNTGTAFTEIEVSDNGIGFEPEYADKIFQLFKRLNDRYSYSGSGIGLALCKKIVSNHNGTITAMSNPGEGARFTIQLPVRQEAFI